MMLFLAKGINSRPHSPTISLILVPKKVLDHEKHNGGVHFSLRGDQDQGGIGGLRYLGSTPPKFVRYKI